MDEKERLMEELIELFESATEEFVDERLNEILDALDKIDPLPPLKSTEESLREFRAAHADLFALLERGRNSQ